MTVLRGWCLWVACHLAATAGLLLAFASIAEAHRLGDSTPHSHGEVELTGFGLLFLSLAAIEAVRAVWMQRSGGVR